MCAAVRVFTHRLLIEPFGGGEAGGYCQCMALGSGGGLTERLRAKVGAAGRWGPWKRKLLKEAAPKRPSHLRLAYQMGVGAVSKHLSKVQPGRVELPNDRSLELAWALHIIWGWHLPGKNSRPFT